MGNTQRFGLAVYRVDPPFRIGRFTVTPEESFNFNDGGSCDVVLKELEGRLIITATIDERSWEIGTSLPSLGRLRLEGCPYEFEFFQPDESAADSEAYVMFTKKGPTKEVLPKELGPVLQAPPTARREGVQVTHGARPGDAVHLSDHEVRTPQAAPSPSSAPSSPPVGLPPPRPSKAAPPQRGAPTLGERRESVMDTTQRNAVTLEEIGRVVRDVVRGEMQVLFEELDTRIKAAVVRETTQREGGSAQATGVMGPEQGLGSEPDTSQGREEDESCSVSMNGIANTRLASLFGDASKADREELKEMLWRFVVASGAISRATESFGDKHDWMDPLIVSPEIEGELRRLESLDPVQEAQFWKRANEPETSRKFSPQEFGETTLGDVFGHDDMRETQMFERFGRLLDGIEGRSS